jgi:acetolactate synthase-1/2/3 large subunit
MLLDSLTATVRQRSSWQTSEIEDFWNQAMNELGAGSAELNAASVLVHARRMAPRDAIVTTEAGVYGRVGLYAWQVYEPGTYFDSSGANTMGYSIPAALAASLVRPAQKTVCLVGDGGFLMRAGELETAARLKLAPVIVIFDDGTLGMIRVKQRSKEYAREGVDLEQTDFVRLTESFGGVGWKVETLEQFDHAFATALESDRLHVIDVRVDADVYASHIKPIRGI